MVLLIEEFSEVSEDLSADEYRIQRLTLQTVEREIASEHYIAPPIFIGIYASVMSYPHYLHPKFRLPLRLRTHFPMETRPQRAR